jgi:hypothetical protein
MMSLGNGSPDALNLKMSLCRSAAKRKQLPKEHLENIQPDRENSLERTVRDLPGDDGAPALPA